MSLFTCTDLALTSVFRQPHTVRTNEHFCSWLAAESGGTCWWIYPRALPTGVFPTEADRNMHGSATKIRGTLNSNYQGKSWSKITLISSSNLLTRCCHCMQLGENFCRLSHYNNCTHIDSTQGTVLVRNVNNDAMQVRIQRSILLGAKLILIKIGS